MATFDTTQLLRMVNLKGALPDGRFQEQDLLDLAYDALLSEIVPMVLVAREDFLVTYADLPITAGQPAYPIPSRALNGVLREVKLIRGQTVVNLDRMDLEDVTTTVPGTPSKFYVSGNSIVLYPTPDTTVDSLRLHYFIRPSRLVPAASCARILSIAGSTLTLSATPSGWTAANTYDLVRGKAHYDILAVDLVATSVAGGTVTLAVAPPTTLAVGDYISLSEETCFPFLPPEGHVALVQSTVTSALESMGDASSASSAQKAEALKATFQAVLRTRIQGEPKALGRRLI